MSSAFTAITPTPHEAHAERCHPERHLGGAAQAKARFHLQYGRVLTSIMAEYETLLNPCRKSIKTYQKKNAASHTRMVKHLLENLKELHQSGFPTVLPQYDITQWTKSDATSKIHDLIKAIQRQLKTLVDDPGTLSPKQKENIEKMHAQICKMRSMIFGSTRHNDLMKHAPEKFHLTEQVSMFDGEAILYQAIDGVDEFLAQHQPVGRRGVSFCIDNKNSCKEGATEYFMSSRGHPRLRKNNPRTVSHVVHNADPTIQKKLDNAHQKLKATRLSLEKQVTQRISRQKTNAIRKETSIGSMSFQS